MIILKRSIWALVCQLDLSPFCVGIKAVEGEALATYIFSAAVGKFVDFSLQQGGEFGPRNLSVV